MSVAEVALTLGFASQSHFTASFHRATGTTPKRYQQERSRSGNRLMHARRPVTPSEQETI
jgi:AraC-like DNA-binding protein